jgi:hypothetical protein
MDRSFKDDNIRLKDDNTRLKDETTRLKDELDKKDRELAQLRAERNPTQTKTEFGTPLGAAYPHWTLSIS